MYFLSLSLIDPRNEDTGVWRHTEASEGLLRAFLEGLWAGIDAMGSYLPIIDIPKAVTRRVVPPE